MTSMVNMAWKRAALTSKEVSQSMNWNFSNDFVFAEKIGGGYFLKVKPENYFELYLQSTNFIQEDRAVNGTDAV